ncbi:MAG: metalloregulator ArsR/SmtB family transcription factor [Methanocella sp.]
MKEGEKPGKSCCGVIADIIGHCKAKVPERDTIVAQSEFFKALSDPARVAIVYALSGGELCNCELMGIMGMPQTAISHHMKVLKYAGIVTDRRSGKWIHYKLTDDKALQALGIGTKK